MNGQELARKIREGLGDRLRDLQEPRPGQVYLTVGALDVPSAARWVHATLGARFLITVGADTRKMDAPLAGSAGLGTVRSFVASHVFSLDDDHLFLTVRAVLDPEKPEIPTITDLIPGAKWAEREIQDLLGVHVNGHPDPRRLVLPDDWPDGIYPLRKEVPYNLRPDPPSMRPKMKEPPEGTTVLPIGPFFPVLEEPAYFRLFVDGERRSSDCDYRGFYNHRGIEKLARHASSPTTRSRSSPSGSAGSAASSTPPATSRRWRTAIGIAAPRRARVHPDPIVLELERIHSHLLWLGIAGHIIGFDTVLMQSWRIREPVMWLCEKITGNRKTYGMNLVGGVRRDIPQRDAPEILDVVAQDREGVDRRREGDRRRRHARTPA